MRKLASLCLVALLVLCTGVLGVSAAPHVEGDVEFTLTADSQLIVRFSTDRLGGISVVEYGVGDELTEATAEVTTLGRRHVHVIPDVEAGTTYSYRIRLRDWVGGETVSSIQEYTTPAVFRVEVVQGFGAEEQAHVSWEPAFGAVAYRVERADSSDGTFTPIGTVEGTRFADRAVENGVSYFYRVVSIDSQGEVASPSDVVEVVPTPGPESGIEVHGPNYLLQLPELPLRVTVGIEYFADRAYTLASYPGEIEGALLIPYRNDDKQFPGDQPYIHLTLYYDTTLYVAFDPRGEAAGWWPDWLQDFERMEDPVTVDGDPGTSYMVLFKREVSAGELILGGNNSNTNESVGYITMLAPR